MAVYAKIVVYLLDVYSFVDNVVFPMEQVVQRMLYYKFLVQAMLETLGVPPLRVRFVQESTCQLTELFQRDFWRLATLVPQQVIRDSWDRAYYPNLMGPMLAPLFQSLGEEHLGADLQFGGADQVGPQYPNSSAPVTPHLPFPSQLSLYQTTSFPEIVRWRRTLLI